MIQSFFLSSFTLCVSYFRPKHIKKQGFGTRLVGWRDREPGRREIQAVCRIGEPANRKVSSQTLEVGLVWDGEERKGGSRGFIITAAKNISLYNPECGQNEGDVFLFHMS